MRERILRVAGGNLVAVMTEPERDPGQDAPLVLIPNTGVEHRVGPNRLHVQWCRAIAGAGLRALRLDLSGMGDSNRVANADQTSTGELRAAMDELQAQELARRFIVVGLSSGAHDAHLLACADRRVVALASIDGYAYPTWRFHVEYWMQRLLDPGRVRRKLRNTLRARAGGDDKAGFAAEQVEFFRQPSAQAMRAELDGLMRRRVHLFYLYTGHVQYEYNYPRQLTDAFPNLRRYDRLELHYMAQADHTFSRSAMRSALADLLLAWLGRVRTCDFETSAHAAQDTGGMLIGSLGAK